MIIADSQFPLSLLADSEKLELDAGLLATLAENRERMLTALAARKTPVYGVNTGMGRLSGVRLNAGQQTEHQRNLLVGRAVGGPPWLSPDEVRTLLLVRLRDLMRPEVAASPELVRFLVDRLNDGFTPAVPRTSLGSAGEIIPLSHAFQTFLGLGTVLEEGVETPAAEALAKRGVEPYVLGPKEGASLIQGSPLAEMYAINGCNLTQQLLDLQALAAGIAIDVLGAPKVVDPYPRTDSHFNTLLCEIGGLVSGSTPRPGVVQAPLSVRVGPRAITHADRVNGDLLDELRRWRENPTDSPAFVGEEFVPTTGFHAIGLGLRMDAVTAALVHLGEISVQRMHRMLDERFSGLPAQLAVDPGPQAGLVPLHKRAVGELQALRRLATPATLGSIDTSGGQEDVQAFASAAGDQLRTAALHLFVITACEFIVGSQARHLAPGDGSRGLRAIYRWIAETVPPVLVDRPLGPELDLLVAKCREAYFNDIETLDLD